MADDKAGKLKGGRVTIDLTSTAAAEVTRLRAMTGLTTADVFRRALCLFRIYVDAKAAGQEFEIINRDKTKPNTRIDLLLTIQKVGRASP